MKTTHDLVRDLYDARLTNNVDAVRAQFSDEALVQLPGSDPSPPTIDKAENSVAKLDAYLETLVTTWDWKRFDLQALIVDGDRATAHYALEATFTPTGETVTTEICDLFTFNSGKIATFVEFVDTALVARLAEGLESSAA